jgi:hypothetical protein
METLKRYLVAGLLLGLAQCASTAGPVTYVHVCPIVPQYSKDFEQQAGNELAFLPPDAALTTMIDDYLAVRAEAKACK